MISRFQQKGGSGGRLTPSNFNSSTTATLSPASSSTQLVNGESDQTYLDRIRVREIISEALLQITRIQPDDPIDFLCNYFESQCQTKPYERALTRLRITDPKHPSFEALLIELYTHFDTLTDNVFLLKGDLYNKLLENLCNNQMWTGSKEHRTTLLSLVSLRPDDAVTFNIFKYGIQAVLLAKEFDKLIRTMYNSMAHHAGANSEIDRSLCEILLQILTDSLAITAKAPNDALSLHESVVKLTPHQVKQALEQRWSPSRSNSKNKLTLEEFQRMAMPIYFSTMTSSVCEDEEEMPFENGELEYAGDEEDDYELNNARTGILDDDGDSEDDVEPVVNIRNNNNVAGRTRSRGSYGDEMNLIDYVIEEEKEIGGAKGEESSTSRSTTYSSLMSNEGEGDDQMAMDQRISSDKAKITGKEEGQMIRARAFLNRLDAKLKEKEETVKQIRESVYLTKDKLMKLEQNKNRLERDIDLAQDQQNITITNRLSSELNRVVRELALEHDVLGDFQAKLDDAEMDRTQVIIERAHYAGQESVLVAKEARLAEQKRTMAQLRQRQEDWKVTQMKRAHLSALQNQKQALDKQAAAQRSAIDEARRSKKLAHKYLQQTFQKARDDRRNEEEASRTEMERKIKSLLNLRGAIERNKDTMTIKTAQRRAHEREIRDAQKREQISLEKEGQNGLFYALRKQKNEKLEQMQQRFAEQQEMNRLEIVEKILKEEHEAERKRKLYPELYKSTTTVPVPPITTIPQMKRTSPVNNENWVPTSHHFMQPPVSVNETTRIVPTSPLDVDPIEYASSMTSAFQHDDFDDEMEVDLAQPDFDGLWDKQPAKQEIDPLFNRSKHWKTKMDKDILQRTLIKLKENIVREQVIGTKRFEGSVPFKSDPIEIHFKDFDVGKVYRMRVTLTNVTLTINTLKLVDLSESLKDFITLKFDPPGMISAGMSCYLNVTFEPKINENLRGEIKFLAQTGMFTVPIRCEIKKVELSLDKTSVNIGTTVVDERLHQNITLHNAGALGTNYRLVKTNVRRAEQTSQTPDTNKVSKDSEEPSAPLEKENSSVSEVTDLVAKEYVEVFSIKAAEQGLLAAHSSLTFPIEFSAPIAGTFHENYTLIFDDNVSELHFSVTAQSIDVPVWIENPSIDLKLCMFDRLYQDGLVLHNRSSAALRVSVDIVPRSLQRHLEIVPRTAYIQAKSSFNLQIKLTAHPSILHEDLPHELFDPTLNTLIVPLEVKVADQIRTVPFNISAILTSSDLEFDVDQIDFGCCTTSESVLAKIQLRNTSLLAQPFGFINLPDYIQIQPNDGFGTLLPQETIDLHVLFSPSTAKEYRCTLVCKSLVNREFSIECQGVGVLPPLSFSSTVIHFPATPINDQSIAVFYVENRHMDKNHFKHPVPRIGNGEFAPVGPTSFEFDVPDNAPITISPLVGTVEPGTRQKITVRLAPKLDNEQIRAESSKIKDRELKRQLDAKEKESSGKGESKTKAAPIVSTSRKFDTQASISSDASGQASGFEQSPDWTLAQLSLMKSFLSSLSSFLIPCYIAPGQCQKPGTLKYDVANTVFVQIHCPIVRPEMIIVSDNGQTTIDFGSASIGQELTRTVLVQNITNKPIHLHSTLLNIDGPFRLANALRQIEPGDTASVKMTFTPNSTSEFLETLELTSDSSKLTLCLKGLGLKPNVQLSFDSNNAFSLGCVVAKERVEKTFQPVQLILTPYSTLYSQIINHSETSVTFRVDLASQHVKNRVEQENKNVWNTAFDNSQHVIGPQNLSGRSVFDVAPLDGIIPAGSKKPLTVSFSPDHDSDFFSDLIRITISDQPVKLEFRVRGSGRQNTMYIRPVDNKTIVQKSLLPNVTDMLTAQMQVTDPNEKGPPTNILVLLCAQLINGKYVPAQRELIIGCATVTTGPKKNGDYTFDNLKDINAEGFNIDTPKSTVEMGTEKVVKVTWTPPANFDPNETCRSGINVTTKGDIMRTWRILLVGYVEIMPSSDKRSSRILKQRATTLTATRSRASAGAASQQLTLNASSQDISKTLLTS